MTERNQPAKRNKIQFTPRAKRIAGALALTAAAVGTADFALRGADREASVQGNSVTQQLAANSKWGSTPSPEAAVAATPNAQPTNVEQVRTGNTKNLALIVTAEGKDIELHAGPNSNSKVVGTVPEGQSIVLERNLSQLNTDEPGNHNWIGGTPDNTTAGNQEWIDESQLDGSAVTAYYPPAGSPENVEYKEAYGVFTATNVEGPVAAVSAPMSQEQALAQVKADGFTATSVGK